MQIISPFYGFLLFCASARQGNVTLFFYFRPLSGGKTILDSSRQDYRGFSWVEKNTSKNFADRNKEIIFILNMYIA